MATRAAIIYFDPEKLEAISTYNHYDGYPEGLGAGLKNHYNDDMYAKKIASEGYISYLDPETGDIEVSNPRDKDVDPDRMRLTDDMAQTAMDIAEMISSYGADYAYIWSPAVEEWMTIKGGSTKSMYTTIDQLMPELFGMGTNPENDMMEEKDYMTEWKSFLNEESFFKDDATTIRWEKIRDNAYRMLKSEDGKQVNAYVDALERQIKFKPSDTDEYIEYDLTDWKADFDDYISDKMDF
jgi:hypothetical protein